MHGHGTRGAIVSRGLIEGARLGKILGADEHSFLGISGVGNIIATFQHSVFYTMDFGQSLDEDKMPVEGLRLFNVLTQLNIALENRVPSYSSTVGLR